MTDKIRSAFDSIHAEDSLKEATLHRLQKQMERKTQLRRSSNMKRLAAAAACLFFVTVAGILSYSAYYTEAAYVDLDINPSLELTVNRFDRIIGVGAYNADGEILLSGLFLQHQKMDAALNEIIKATAQAGVLQENGLVSVTVQAVSGDESRLISGIQAEVASLASHHAAVQVDVFSVDSDTRNAAHDQHISPARYLAILELQEVDPTASIETCRNHTIGEIRQRTQDHGGGHHEASNGGQNTVEDGKSEFSESGNRSPSDHHGNRH